VGSGGVGWVGAGGGVGRGEACGVEWALEDGVRRGGVFCLYLFELG